MKVSRPRKYMKRYALFAMVFLVATTKSQQELSPTENNIFNNHVAHIKKFREENKPHINIAKGIAKIAGAFVLSGFTFRQGKFLAIITRYARSEVTKKTAPANFQEDWLTPRTAGYNPNENKWAYIDISRPPYLTVFAIASYLISSGSYNLYKGITALNNKDEKPPKETDNAQESETEDTEELIKEAQANTPEPEKTTAAGVAHKYTPIRLTSYE